MKTLGLIKAAAVASFGATIADYIINPSLFHAAVVIVVFYSLIYMWIRTLSDEKP